MVVVVEVALLRRLLTADKATRIFDCQTVKSRRIFSSRILPYLLVDIEPSPLSPVVGKTPPPDLATPTRRQTRGNASKRSLPAGSAARCPRATLTTTTQHKTLKLCSRSTAVMLCEVCVFWKSTMLCVHGCVMRADTYFGGSPDGIVPR